MNDDYMFLNYINPQVRHTHTHAASPPSGLATRALCTLRVVCVCLRACACVWRGWGRQCGRDTDPRQTPGAQTHAHMRESDARSAVLCVRTQFFFGPTCTGVRVLIEMASVQHNTQARTPSHLQSESRHTEKKDSAIRCPLP